MNRRVIAPANLGRGRPLSLRLRGFKPVEVVYTRYVPDPARPGEVTASPRNHVFCRAADIESFVRERLNPVQTLPPPALTRQKPPEDPYQGERDIDIYTAVPCYVVIELDPALDLQFKKNHPGITADRIWGASNGQLRHLMPDGKIVGANGPTGDGCRILFFGVKTRRKDHQHQQFYCHVESFTKGRDPVAIDPDIPNDGGKFPVYPYPRSPCCKDCATPGHGDAV